MTVVEDGGGMRIVVHDYAGHPFQVQLSRSLAVRGHDVLHLHAAGFQTPKGPLERRVDDPPTFGVEGIDIGEPFRKYSFARRLLQERRYGGLLADRIAAFDPDVVISANSPLDVQAAAEAQAHRADAAFVFWIQDIYSVAIDRILGKRLPFFGRIAAARFNRLERRLLRDSDAVVAITEDFLALLDRWGVPSDRITVVENWAPLDGVTPLPKTNAWSIEHRLTDASVLLYAGTLGLKHDPSLLLALAHELPDSTVVVISEGLGADWLRDRAATQRNLVLLPFEPFERLSEVLASADVLLVILEPDAGVFSVPSKVLTYLTASRPILGAIPHQNLAARTIKRIGAGQVVEPGDVQGFVAAARRLLDDPVSRDAAGRAGRAYAEGAFDIGRVADRFETILRDGIRARQQNASVVGVRASIPPSTPRPEAMG